MNGEEPGAPPFFRPAKPKKTENSGIAVETVPPTPVQKTDDSPVFSGGADVREVKDALMAFAECARMLDGLSLYSRDKVLEALKVFYEP